MIKLESNMKKILILGCGYLGYNLATALSEDYDVLVISRKNRYISDGNVKFKLYEFDYVDLNVLNEFDLSGYIVINALGSITPNKDINYISEDLKFYDMLTTLLIVLSKKNIRRLIQISSGGTVYGNKNNLPIVEDEALEATSIYSLQKIFFEEFLKVNYYENGIPYSIMRISNPYGGYQILNKQQGLIPIVIKNIISNTNMNIWADLNTIRDYIYISDLVKAFRIIIENDECENEVYNVGSGIGTSIKEIIQICEHTTNNKLNYIHEPKNIASINKNILDIGKIKNLGFEIETNLSQGIKMEYDRIRNDN